MSRRNLHALAEERSLDLHREIAAKILDDPAVIEAARARVRAWRSNGTVHRHYVDAWEEVLARDAREVGAFLVDPSETARELRQVSPFGGILDPRTRWRIHEATYQRWKRQ